jgi:ABC-type nitrate/sulfonate/bicarbonate transport system permease component
VRAARARLTDAAAGTVPLALIVTLWFVLTTFGLAPTALLPAPQTVLLRLCALLADP